MTRAMIATLLTAIGTWGTTALADSGLQPAEWMGLLVALGGALSARQGRPPRRRRRRTLAEALGEQPQP
jgi:hypothetical protein